MLIFMTEMFTSPRSILQTTRSLLLLLVVFTLSRPAPVTAQIGWAEPWSDAVVVTAEERATQAGLDILEQGGNAVDAAVGVQFALAVTLPRAGNIGGGGFMVVQMADGTRASLDFREKAPAKAHRDMFLDENREYLPNVSRRGPLASGVPGVVDGMAQALERFGTLSLEEVLQPAIRLAREGYPLSYTQASELNSAAESLSQFDASRGYFLRTDGREWEKGDLFIQPDLARTLERIACEGRDGFYKGETARLIAEQMERTDGWITKEDLANYRAQWRVPIRSRWHGYELLMMPPPSSGGLVVQQILEMSEPFDLAAMGHNSADYIHTLSEAMRRSFADRNHHLGDPDFVEIPIDYLTRKAYLRDRMSSFDPGHASTSEEITHGNPARVIESDETTHYSILDSEGSAVAITTTLNGSFGSMMSVAGAGFLLNNEMDDFTSKPGEANMFGLVEGANNAIEPGKRMLSSMTPTLVTRDGTVRAVLGAAGGPRIITATLQTFLNLTLFEMNAREAMNAPRFHHQWLPDRIWLEEYAGTADTERILEERGHQVDRLGTVGRVHLIWVDDEGDRYAVPDPRGSGFGGGLE